MNEVIYDMVRNHISLHKNTNFTTLAALVEETVRECIGVVEQFRGRMDATSGNIVVGLKDHFGIDNAAD